MEPLGPEGVLQGPHACNIHFSGEGGDQGEEGANNRVPGLERDRAVGAAARFPFTACRSRAPACCVGHNQAQEFYLFIGLVGSSLLCAVFTCSEHGLLFIAVHGSPIAVASLIAEHSP